MQIRAVISAKNVKSALRCTDSEKMTSPI